jgi:hypothetical protein
LVLFLGNVIDLMVMIILVYVSPVLCFDFLENF